MRGVMRVAVSTAHLAAAAAARKRTLSPLAWRRRVRPGLLPDGPRQVIPHASSSSTASRQVGLRTSEPLPSPMPRGYSAEKVRLLWVEPPAQNADECESWLEDDADGPPTIEPRLVVRCRPRRTP